jgi:hypothetical protein
LLPLIICIYLNKKRLSISSAEVAIKKIIDLKERTTEALQLNQQLDNIQSGLHPIFRKWELSEDISLELIKSEYLGKKRAA